jgi:hypothetical protein
MVATSKSDRRPRRRPICAVLALLCMLVWLSFADSWRNGGEMVVLLPLDPTLLTVLTAKGEMPFRVEIASDEVTRDVGLMFREAMPDDQGMLFVYQAQQPLRFWMTNTPMALDLIFLSAKMDASSRSSRANRNRGPSFRPAGRRATCWNSRPGWPRMTIFVRPISSSNPAIGIVTARNDSEP